MKKKTINISFKDYKTHINIFGDIKTSTPIIALHGGPGGNSYSFEPLYELADKGVPFITYDQCGCGYSKIKGKEPHYDTNLFIEELENLIKTLHIDEFVLLGHSWGGMLALSWVTSKKIKGLKGLILFSTLPSTKIWNDEHALAIENMEMNEEFKTAALNNYHDLPFDHYYYQMAVKMFYVKHIFKRPLKSRHHYKRIIFPRRNDTIYRSMWGDDELFGKGSLKDYDVTDSLCKIDVPTLILSGRHDESTPNMNSLMHEKISNSKWVILENSAHCGYADEPQKTRKTIINWYKDILNS